MPTYEYHCDGCEHHFDEFQSITEEALKTCPACQEPKLRRVFGAGAAILFKGSGFYQTDYRSASYKAAAKAEAESTGTKSTSKADANGSSANGSTTAAKTSKSPT